MVRHPFEISRIYLLAQIFQKPEMSPLHPPKRRCIKNKFKVDVKTEGGDIVFVASYEFYRMLGDLHRERRKVPFLRASTLLVSGYITPDEVEQIAKHVSEVSPDIPYSLLAFSPRFDMRSLTFTSKKLALESKDRVTKYLDKVRIGSIWLLTLATFIFLVLYILLKGRCGYGTWRRNLRYPGFP